MNVILFSDTFLPEINGVATSTFNLQKTLKAHGHNCLVVTTSANDKQVTFIDDVIRVPGLNLKKLYGYRLSFFYNKDAMKIITSFKPDVVHCQTDAGIGIFGRIVANTFHIPAIYTFHTMVEDYTYYFTKGHLEPLARDTVRTFFKTKARGYSYFIAPSIKIKDYLRAIGIDINVSIVPTGIELDRFIRDYKREEEALKLREQYGIEPDDFVILSLGRIAKEKSIDLIIKGYATFLKTATRKTKLVITGWGPAEKELKELAYTLGVEKNVIFTGPCKPDQVYRFYHLGNAFVSASVTETQGLTFIEAMASSLVVLARYDDNLEGMIEDRKNGFFFYDEDDFVKKISEVINFPDDKKKEIITNALASIGQYSMDRFYKNIMEVYTRVEKSAW